jgi:hypothetical protein
MPADSRQISGPSHILIPDGGFIFKQEPPSGKAIEAEGKT